MNSQLTKIKQEIKKNKPEFHRQNYGALPRIKSSWRKPKGIHSKLRHGFAGHQTRVEPGYGTPAELRGTGKEGLIPILVHTTKELQGLDTKKHGVILAHTGLKKKTMLVKIAQEKKLTILNLKNPTQFLHETEQKLKKRKTNAEQRSARQHESEKPKPKEPAQEKQKDQTPVEKQTSEKTTENKSELNSEGHPKSEIKDEKKKELDKLLTKKEQ